MKNRLMPVIFTAALTSVMTLYVANRYQDHLPFLSASRQIPLPVSYAGFNDGNNTLKTAGNVNFEDAAAGSVKAVVHIKTTSKARTVVAQDPFAQLFGDDFFGGTQRQYYLPPQAGSGSGVVISPDGYIVTNNHVVAGADQMTVTFNDRYTTQAKVIATDPTTDIALVKVNEKNLPYMAFGNSDDVRLGQWVLAVGYPLTLDATVTAGIVSAKSRSIGINKQAANAIESYIQTDAAVNPGNSGGALVNTRGELIGINSAIASPTGSYAGYSYAVPSNIVRKVVNDLMQYGSVQRAILGVNYLDRKNASPEQLSALGIDKNDGVYVADVRAGFGAAKAGIKKGDFITQINGVAIHSEPELQEQVARYKPGDNISVTYTRDGREYRTSLELKNINGNTSVLKDQASTLLLGANFRALTSQEKNSLGIKSGVVVTDVGNGALAQQTNMKKGFVITSINDHPVASVDDLQGVLVDGATTQIAGFYPGYKGMYYYGLNGAASGGEQ